MFALPETLYTYTTVYPGRALPEKNISRLIPHNLVALTRLIIALRVSVQETLMARTPHQFVKNFLHLVEIQRGSHLPFKYADFKINLSSSLALLGILVDIMQLDKPTISNDTSLSAKSYADLFDTIIIYNEYQVPSLDFNYHNHDLLFNINLLQELNAENPAHYTRTGMAKQAIFNSFLRHKLGDKYESFTKDVNALLGVEKETDVLVMYGQILAAHQKATNNPYPVLIVAPTDPFYARIEKLKLVSEWEIPDKQTNLATMISTPFIRMPDKHLYLAGVYDLGHLSSKGWMYYLFQSGPLQKALNLKNYTALLGDLGKSYYEEFLFYNLIKSLERPGIRVLPDKINFADVTLIINERDIFLFEVKSCAMHFKTLLSRNVSEYKNWLDENLVIGGGYSQLQKNISFLSKTGAQAYGIKTPISKLRIHPIIIYTEHHLTKYGINDYINQSGEALPSSVTEDFKSVLPITMIHLDFFLDNIFLFARNRSFLRELILRYHAEIEKAKIKYRNKITDNNFVAMNNFFENIMLGYKGIYKRDHIAILNDLKSIYNKFDHL